MKGERAKIAEDPVEALFSLASEAEEMYSSIKNIAYYAYFFIVSALVFLLILMIALVSEGNIALVVFLAAVFISGIVLLRLVVFTRNFVEYFVSRFRKINMVRKMDILVQLPGDGDEVDRILAYLSGEVSTGYRPVKPFRHGDINIPGALVRTGLRKGIIPVFRMRTPTLKEIVAVENAVEAIITSGMRVDRVALLYSPTRGYDGLPDDVYTYLVEGKFSVEHRGRRQPVPVQMFVFTPEGCEIIPPILI